MTFADAHLCRLRSRNNGGRMFSRTNKPGSTTPPVPPAPVRPAEEPTVISASCAIIGNILQRGEVILKGEMQGDLSATSVRVSETGKLEGSIIADDVDVGGHVLGTVRGKRVILRSTAQVEGDIYHSALSLEQGTSFEGKSRRSDDPTGLAAPQYTPISPERRHATPASATRVAQPVQTTVRSQVKEHEAIAKDETPAVIEAPTEDFVFISYSQTDRDMAAELAQHLEARGINAWFDIDLEPGQNFNMVIQQKLLRSRAVIVIWSKKSVESMWVQSEATIGQKKNKLVTLKTADLGDDDIPPPFNMLHADLVTNIDAACKALRAKGFNPR